MKKEEVDKVMNRIRNEKKAMEEKEKVIGSKLSHIQSAMSKLEGERETILKREGEVKDMEKAMEDK